MSARLEVLEGIPFFQTLDGDQPAAVARLRAELLERDGGPSAS